MAHIEAAAIPFPIPERTPPVTNINFTRIIIMNKKEKKRSTKTSFSNFEKCFPKNSYKNYMESRENAKISGIFIYSENFYPSSYL